MKVALQWQRGVFLLSALGLLATNLAGVMIPLSWQIIALAALVTMIGLPHGALDPLVAHRAGLWQGPFGLMLFIALYLLVAGVALAAWITLPDLSLAIFLVLSAWHFANDWRPKIGPIYRTWAGVAIIALPAFSHPAEVEILFEQLASPSSAAVITLGLARIAPVLLVGLLMTTIALLRHHYETSLELLALAICALVLPPLLFFILYFSLQHSPRHLIRSVKGLRPAVAVFTGTLFTALAVGAGILAFVAMPQSTLDERLLRIIFIGLAVMTVPHMILIEITTRRYEPAKS